MICRVCKSQNTSEVGERCQKLWHHCHKCGSHSCESICDASVYDEDYVRVNVVNTGGLDKLTESMSVNFEWMNRHHNPSLPKTFLDVGCNEGVAITEMRRRGWESFGFDVNPHSAGDGVVIGKSLTLSSFPGQRFSMVMCREVIEHVEDWRELLSVMCDMIFPGGHLHLQTPTPMSQSSADQDLLNMVYTPAHVQVFSEIAIKNLSRDIGLKEVESLFWEGGQAWMFLKS